MKRILKYGIIFVAIIVAYNIRNRAGHPSIEWPSAWPLLADRDVPQRVAEHFLRPGTITLWYLGLSIDTPGWLCLNLFISWHVWLVGARFVFFYVGRRLGIAPLLWFGLSTRLVFPWRFFYRRYLKLARWRSQLSYGAGPTGSWMSSPGVANRIYLGGDQVFLGRTWLD